MNLLDMAVFLFGVLIFTLIGAGILLAFYGYAYLEMIKSRNIQLGDRMQRVMKFVLGEDAP
jgi:hypothetical protein